MIIHGDIRFSYKLTFCITRGYYYTYMTDKEKIVKIKEIEMNFIKELRKIEKERDEKLKIIKKCIDQRKIDAILSELKK